MFAMKAAEPTLPASARETEFPTQTWESGTAAFTARWGRSGGVVTVRGEIDAANAGGFAEHLNRCVDYGDWLVLDLSNLEFMGTAGFSTLQIINTRCAKADVYWVLVRGAAVSRLLRACDPESVLPVVQSVSEALTTLQARRGLLHLVT